MDELTIDQVQIREAIAADIPALFEIRTAVTENAMTEADLAASGITPERSAELLRTEGRCWVAEAGKPVVGFCIANSRTRSIWALFVLPEYEGRGIGRRLLEPAVDWLWRSGTDELWLTTETDTRAEGFYEHLGWRRGEVAIEDGYEEVRYTLKKSISPSLD